MKKEEIVRKIGALYRFIEILTQTTHVSKESRDIF